MEVLAVGIISYLLIDNANLTGGMFRAPYNNANPQAAAAVAGMMALGQQPGPPVQQPRPPVQNIEPRDNRRQPSRGLARHVVNNSGGLAELTTQNQQNQQNAAALLQVAADARVLNAARDLNAAQQLAAMQQQNN